MLTVNIALDIFCFALMLIPTIYMFNKSRFRQKPNGYFLGICAANALMIVGDLFDWIFPVTTERYIQIVVIAFTLVYYISTAFVLYFFGLYMDEYLKMPRKIKSIFMNILKVMCGAQLLLSIVSPFTGSFFYVAENGYQRGNLFIISQAVPIVCYIMFTTMLIKYHKNLSKSELVFFLLYIFMPMAAEMLQIFLRGIAVVNVGVTLSLLFIFVNIQLERDLLMEQKERELEQLRVNIMLSQIQPHFLYNSLTTIRQLCDIDPKLAKETIRDFRLR